MLVLFHFTQHQQKAKRTSTERPKTKRPLAKRPSHPTFQANNERGHRNDGYHVLSYHRRNFFAEGTFRCPLGG
jgi:hypothetical protein